MQGFMQGLWIYPEDTEVLGVACKSLLKALQPRYQKIALFSPIRPYDGGCEGFLGCYGLNPLEGLIMGTRCGDIDPTVVEYIAQCANKSLEEVMKILNHESGLKGICGDNDARNIEARKEKGDKEAKLAFEMCTYRIKKHIGAYMVALGRVDAIIFTGGLGENYSALRESVCEGLENLGIALHKPTNDNPGNGLVDLSQPDAKVKVLRIPTDEELEIALQAKEIVEKLK